MKKPSAQATQLKPARIYQIKVALKWSKPPIWRRLQVRGDTKLGKLHQILQITTGGGTNTSTPLKSAASLQ